MGPPVVKSLRKAVPRGRSFFDCHMMVSNPDQWVDVFAECGAGNASLISSDSDLYCFHIEALNSDEEIDQVITHVKNKGMKVGIAIKPKTPSSALYKWIPKIDMALVMVILHLLILITDSRTRLRRTKSHHVLFCQSLRSP